MNEGNVGGASPPPQGPKGVPASPGNMQGDGEAKLMDMLQSLSMEADFGKLVAELMAESDNESIEDSKKDKKIKEKNAESKGLVKGESAERADLQVEFEASVATSTQNTLSTSGVKSANNPTLPAPSNQSGQIPTGKSGLQNPWLKPSLATAMFLAMFEILPILMEIKVEEAKSAVKEMTATANLVKAKADTTVQGAEKQAEILRSQAMVMFISVGMQLGAMVVSAAVQLVAQVVNTTMGVVQQGMSAAGSAMGSLTGGKTGGSGGGTKLPTMDADQITKGIEQLTSMAEKIMNAVQKMYEAQLTVEKGRLEAQGQILDNMISVSRKMQDSAREAKKEASELIGTFIQALMQFIQYQQVFAIKPGYQ